MVNQLKIETLNHDRKQTKLVRQLKIEKFMKQINQNWGDFRKARFIFRKLGEIYNYDPQYIYSNSIIQNDIILNAIKSAIILNEIILKIKIDNSLTFAIRLEAFTYVFNGRVKVFSMDDNRE